MHRAITTLLSFLLIGQFSPANADFSDDFRAFIVGNDTPNHAAPTTAIDNSAQACLTCHDGSHATAITVRRRGSPLQIRGSQTLNHPIGMNYDESVRHDPQGYRVRTALHPNIQFINGQVTCVSCHQIKNSVNTANTQTSAALTMKGSCTATKQLTTGYGDRALCLSCHIK